MSIPFSRLLVKEYSQWCDIFNKYKEKLEIFYNYSKAYKKTFSEINEILSNTCKKSNVELEKFNLKIPEIVYKYSSNMDFKIICKF